MEYRTGYEGGVVPAPWHRLQIKRPGLRIFIGEGNPSTRRKSLPQ